MLFVTFFLEVTRFGEKEKGKEVKAFFPEVNILKWQEALVQGLLKNILLQRVY
jgi:hypothetical protein